MLKITRKEPVKVNVFNKNKSGLFIFEVINEENNILLLSQ